MRILQEAKRYNVVACGRRFGKTMLGIHLLSRTLDYPAAWFSPIYKDMLEVWRDVIKIYKPIIKRVNASERRIELITDGVIEFWSNENPDGGKGRKYKQVIFDEAAISMNLKTSWEQAIRQTLTDYRGSAWFFSTPKSHNYFWQLYQKGIDSPSWKSWSFPTAMNPYIDKDEIDEAEKDLPEAIFRQEYLAEFLASDGSVFRNINNCISEDTGDHSGHEIVFGVDWGKQNDFTAISVNCVTCRQEIDTDRFNKINYSFQRERLKVLIDKWKPARILAEQNSIGDPIIDQLQREGVPIIPFMTTAQSKPKLIENLALTLERAEWHFLPDPIWLGELEAYERVVSPSTGRSSYSAPAGMHDDTVIARALAIWEAINYNWYMI